MAAQGTINLLPPDEFEKTFTGQSLKWILTVGRYIIIGTNLILILAFLSRFKLDKDLTDLNDNIKGKVAIINSFQDLEEKTRLAQAQLKAVKNLTAEELKAAELFDSIDKNTPLQVVLSSLTVDKEKGLTIEGLSFSEVDLATFQAKLNQLNLFKDVYFEKLLSGGQEGPEIKFTLKLNLLNSIKSEEKK